MRIPTKYDISIILLGNNKLEQALSIYKELKDGKDFADLAKKYSKSPDYPQRAREALKEMYRQVGDLHINEMGLAEYGLLVRHLVLPHGLAGTKEVMNFIAKEISPYTYVNIMAQYRPCGEAYRDPLINRPITIEEYEEAIQAAIKAGLKRLHRQI